MTKMQKRRSIYISLLSVFFLIFAFSGFNVRKILDDSKSTKHNLIYTNTSKVDYDLLLTENEFIKPHYVKSYETYISSLVREIDMTMSYSYKGSSKLPIEVRRRVVATIYGLYNANPTDTIKNPIMWKKEFIIKDYKTDAAKKMSEFEVKENFKLDFDMFNREVIRFKENFSLPTISNLDVTLEVEFAGSDDKYTLKEKQVVSAKMPLAEQVFSIDTNKDYSEEKSVLSNEMDMIRKGQRKLTAYVVLTALSLLLMIITFKQIVVSKDKQPFNEEIAEIKRSYDEIVVETKNMFNTKGLNPIKIMNFDEMLNLADSLIVPIMLYEETNKATFYILKGDMFYFYIMENKNKITKKTKSS